MSTFLSDDMLAFVNALTTVEMMSRDDLVLYLEKPWKWDAEFAIWKANGCPPEPDPTLIELMDAAA